MDFSFQTFCYQEHRRIIRTRYTKLVFVLVGFLFTSTCLFAQESRKTKYYANDARHWVIELPLWVPGFRGQLAYGEFNSSSAGSISEKEHEKITGNTGLEFYFVGRITAKYNRFWIQTDAFSGRINSAFTYDPLIGNEEKQFVNITIQGTVPRIMAGFSILKKTTKAEFQFEAIPYIGVRYVGLHIESDIFDLTEVIDIKPNWYEPIIGVIIPMSYKRFRLELQLDYGATQWSNSWINNNRFRYRISNLIDIQVGWTLMHLNHTRFIAGEQLDLQIRLSGPSAGIGFRF